MCNPLANDCLRNSLDIVIGSTNMLHNFSETSFQLKFSLSDQPNILFVERSYANATTFELKTNKYVGPREEEPAQLQLLDRYDTLEDQFQFKRLLFPDKLNNLQGREVVIAGFDYRPYTVIKYVMLSLTLSSSSAITSSTGKF